MNRITPAEEAIRAVDPWRRADFITWLIDLAVYFEIHTDVPVPDTGLFTIPALGDGPDERKNDVLATAVALGVYAERQATDDEEWLRAARQFGTLTVQACTPPTRKAAKAA